MHIAKFDCYMHNSQRTVFVKAVSDIVLYDVKIIKDGRYEMVKDCALPLLSFKERFDSWFDI